MKHKAAILTLLAVAGVIVIVKVKPKQKTLLTKKLEDKNEVKLNTLHPAFRDKAKAFIAEAAANGIFLIVVQALRSMQEQAAIYAQGRTTPGAIVTKAKPGDSLHNFGLAFDVAGVKGAALDYNLDWKKLAAIAKKYNIDWGGNFKSFKDKPHFEYKAGNTLAQLKAKQKAGDLNNGFVNLA